MTEDLQDIINRMVEPAPWNRIWCGPGWYKIIVECHNQLKAIDPDYKVLQIKDKFNSLRFYFESQSTRIQEMYNIVHKYEHLSQSISQYPKEPDE